jgi:undecaprenyl-diphosphatase
MIFWYLILGLIQGFTEPIPVSSSGHMIIFQSLFNLDALNDLNFLVFANFGSLLAIIIIFWKDIVDIVKDFFLYIKTKEKKYYHNFRYGLFIIVATIPAGIVGLLFNDIIEEYMSNVKFVGVALLITAFFLFIIRKKEGYKNEKKMTMWDAIKVGLFQIVALFPGISRSGATIVGGMFSGLDRQTAFKFSFLLYIPISLATMLLGVKDVISTSISVSTMCCYMVGMLAAFILTYYATKWFKDIMIKGKLIYFVYYCLIAGILVILFL